MGRLFVPAGLAAGDGHGGRHGAVYVPALHGIIALVGKAEGSSWGGRGRVCKCVASIASCSSCGARLARLQRIHTFMPIFHKTGSALATVLVTDCWCNLVEPLTIFHDFTTIESHDITKGTAPLESIY